MKSFPNLQLISNLRAMSCSSLQLLSSRFTIENFPSSSLVGNNFSFKTIAWKINKLKLRREKNSALLVDQLGSIFVRCSSKQNLSDEIKSRFDSLSSSNYHQLVSVLEIISDHPLWAKFEHSLSADFSRSSTGNVSTISETLNVFHSIASR